MTMTKQIPRTEWHAYFEAFTKRHLHEGRAETVTIDVLSPDLGDQIEARDVALRGISYDPKGDVLDVYVSDVLDHLVYKPRDIYVVEEDDGFISSLQISHDGDVKEILQIKRPPAQPQPEAATAPR